MEYMKLIIRKIKRKIKEMLLMKFKKCNKKEMKEELYKNK